MPAARLCFACPPSAPCVSVVALATTTQRGGTPCCGRGRCARVHSEGRESLMTRFLEGSQSLPQERDSYQTFLQNKRAIAHPTGMEVPLPDIHPRLFPFQRVLVQWALRKGRAALCV